ncbi:hypothetical protein [Streptomyces sp. NPDC101776]|uniref:hypothetical protein n=1 Tax=Streptomyces sp. NPDC101776 TaxID=3366146 RepID=UPI0038007253
MSKPSPEYVLNRARVQGEGTRFAALRDGTVTLYAHTRAEKGDVIWTSSVLRWIEAEVAPGETERKCNASVSDLRPGYVCFDRDNVRTALHGATVQRSETCCARTTSWSW